jgi:hypothetical protein
MEKHVKNPLISNSDLRIKVVKFHKFNNLLVLFYDTGQSFLLLPEQGLIVKCTPVCTPVLLGTSMVRIWIRNEILGRTEFTYNKDQKH